MEKVRMSVPPPLRDRLRLPVIGAPMFLVSGPVLVLAQCAAGSVGSFPALNARPYEMLDIWLTRISKELSDMKVRHPHARLAPFAVNQIVHSSNQRLQQDLDVCVKHKVPIWTSAPAAPRRRRGATSGARDRASAKWKARLRPARSSTAWRRSFGKRGQSLRTARWVEHYSTPS